jgi:hypothetical protein
MSTVKLQSPNWGIIILYNWLEKCLVRMPQLNCVFQQAIQSHLVIYWFNYLNFFSGDFHCSEYVVQLFVASDDLLGNL